MTIDGIPPMNSAVFHLRIRVDVETVITSNSTAVAQALSSGTIMERHDDGYIGAESNVESAAQGQGGREESAGRQESHSSRYQRFVLLFCACISL